MIWRALLLCSLLAGCGTVADKKNPILAGLNTLQGSQPALAPRFASLVEQDVPRLQVSIIETGANATLLLERQNGNFAYWLTVDGSHLVLESGLLHGTRGFGEGLLASELGEPLALVRSRRDGWSDRFHTYLDGNDRAVTRTYRCLIENKGQKETKLLGGTVKTELMSESCRSLDQKFLNFYWVVPATGQIVLSRQWAGPEIGQISIRVVPR